MSARPGTRFGSYEIVAAIGAGGMGEVFRARDTRLNRDVALKMLPDAYAGDPERLARFTREAQSLAALNHPHIAQIYGLEEAAVDGAGGSSTSALVMELVDGEDLARRIMRGKVPLDEAVAIAKQVADALDAAHDAGIVHRDLKPANIKLRADGVVKVLDFGLAKLTASTDVEQAHSPTITAQDMTRRGAVLGTAAYMAPEQARGKPVDKRADIWAFGCVFYEMLTGTRTFVGETTSDTIAEVLRKELTWSDLPPGTPAAVVALLHQCLQRDPARRLRDAGDIRVRLDDLDREPVHDSWSGLEMAPRTAARSGVRPPASPPSPPSPGRRSTLLPVAVAASLAAGIAGGWLLTTWLRAPEAASAPVVRFTILPPAGVTDITNVAFAADGSFLVYEGVSSGRGLFVRRLDEAESRPVAGTEGGRWPFLSPDGRWVGFFRGGKLMKVALTGGDALTLCDARGGPGAAWGPAGRILFATSWTGDNGLLSVSEDGGTPTAVPASTEPAVARGHWWPAFLPGARHVLVTAFMAGAGLNDNRVAVLDLDTGQVRILFAGARAFWLDSGHILFFHAGRYQVVPFDAQALEVTGEPTAVLDDALQIDPTGDWPQPVAVSPSGAVAYVPGRYVPDSRLVWVASDGSLTPLPFPVRPYMSVALSPDGHRLAAGSFEGGTMRLRVLDLRQQTEQLLEFDGMNWGAAWHPDGDRLAFTTVRKGDLDVHVAELDSDRGDRPLLNGPEDASVVAWTRDGQLVTRSSDAAGAYRLVMTDAADPSRPPRVVSGGEVLPGASISPDERWVAYSAAQGDTRQVFVKALAEDQSGGRIVSRGGTQPVFGRRPGELWYRRGRSLVRLPWSDQASRFAAGEERVVAELSFGSLAGYPGPYDVAADGRVLAIVRASEPEPPRVTVVLQWVRALAPAAGQGVNMR